MYQPTVSLNIGSRDSQGLLIDLTVTLLARRISLSLIVSPRPALPPAPRHRSAY